MTRARGAFLGATSLFVLATCLGAPAYAQSAAPAEEDELVITGFRASLRDSINTKRTSPLVVEAITADDIGQLPDVTIAESLVRLPGINGTRDRGNESQAVIRGLGARLVLGTINGRETASSEPDRNIRWEIYPSEVVSGVQVYKSQAADLIAGGVAGTVNISTVRPLEYDGPTFVLRAGPVYYEMGAEIPDYDPYGYRASGSFITHVGEDFAIALGVSMQNQRNAYPSVQGWGYNDHTMRPPQGASDNTGDIDSDGSLDPTPWGFQSEVKKLDQDRLGVMGAAQWSPSSEFTLTFDMLYSEVNIHEEQDQTVYANNRGNWANGNAGDYLAAAGYTQVNGDVVAVDMLPFAGVMSVIADYTEDKTLFVTGLNAEVDTGALSITTDLSYSMAERDNQWKAVRLNTYPAWMSYDMRAGVRPTVSTSPDLTTIWPVASSFDAWGESAGPDNLRDELIALAIDADYDFGATEGFTSLEFGARLSGRDKNQTALQWFPQPLNVFFDPTGPILSSYSVPEFVLPRMLTADFQTLADAAYGPNAFNISNASADLLGTWGVSESVFEAYAKANFETNAFGVPVDGNFGVRFVDVGTTSEGYSQATGGGAFTQVSVDHEYSNVLPSASINFHLSDDMLLRFGAAQVIARPPLDELRASRSLSGFAPFTGTAGNPTLDPFEATQFDVSWEWYFQEEALLAIAGYYKDVESNIGWIQTPQDFGGTTYLVSSPTNGGGGTISGLEITFQTPFDFIGLDNFGVYTNYAFVNSDLEEFVPITDPLDSAGLAENTATLDFWYDNGHLEARIGAKYHSPFTVIYGWDGSQLQTLEEETVVDFSLGYRFTDSFAIRFQANNLTNEVSRLHRDNRPDRLGRYDIYGRRYLLDVAYSF